MAHKNSGVAQNCAPGDQFTSRRGPRTRAKKVVRKEEGAEGDTEVNIPYYEDFRIHVEEVRAHLAGQWLAEEEQEEQDGPGLPEHPLFESHWTLTEKDAFFHAISTSSRFRPDLLAAIIKTKSPFEVCLYMKALERGLAELQAAELEPDPETSSEDDGDDDDNPVPVRIGQKRKRGLRYEMDTQKETCEEAALQRRAGYPAANEMSTAWIQEEETISRVVCRLEDEQYSAGQIDVRATPAAFNASEDGDLKTSNLYLVPEQLQILDRILRESEDVLLADPEEVPPKSCCAASGSANSMDAQEKSVGAFGQEDDDLDDEEINAYIQPRLETDAQEYAEDTRGDGGLEEEMLSKTDLAKMTPAARRRFKNRLYMRKKRALKRGIDVESVDLTSVRLRPGRAPAKWKVEAVENGKEEVEEADQLDESDNEGDQEPVLLKKRTGKWSTEFTEAGIDENVLEQEGLTLLNLPGIGKMLSFFTAECHDRSAHGTPAVSTELIRVMVRVLVEFTVELMRKAMTIAQTHYKTRVSKIWRRTHPYVTVDSIKMAMRTMGLRLEDRQKYMGRIVERAETSSERQRQRRGRQEASKDEAGVKIISNYPNGLPKESVHRMVYQPFVHIPKEYQPSEELRQQNEYGPTAILRFTTTAYDSGGEEPGMAVDPDILEEEGQDEDEDEKGTDKEDCEDPILCLDSDSKEEEEFERQMAEEDELDVADMAESMEYEQELRDAILVE